MSNTVMITCRPCKKTVALDGDQVMVSGTVGVPVVSFPCPHCLGYQAYDDFSIEQIQLLVDMATAAAPISPPETSTSQEQRNG